MAENLERENVSNSEEHKPEGAGDALEGVDVAPGSVESVEAAASEKGPVDEVGRLKSELDQAKREVAELRDAWTRERAEFQNYKKRVIQDQARTRIDAMTDFAKKLFPLIDNLERVAVVKTDNENLRSYVSGVEMVYQGFCQALESEAIRKKSPVNEPFDPKFMEALAMEEREGLSQDTVVEVFQAGYVFDRDNEVRPLRSAMVKVGKPVQKKEGGTDAGEAG